MMTAMDKCQHELHQWGHANQVSFGKEKEGMYMLRRKSPQGDEFKLLDISFHCKLVMSAMVEQLAKTCQWKLKAVLRTNWFSTLVNLYKVQTLSFIEYRTAAIYHVCDSALALLDAVQEKVLKLVGITKLQALNDVHLAPLCVRRDVPGLVGDLTSSENTFSRMSM